VPLIFKLSIDTTKSFQIVYVVLIILASKVSINRVEWFFFAPIWLCNNKACFLAVSAIYFVITFFSILLRVFFKAIG
jgi:hypothetical protein